MKIEKMPEGYLLARKGGNGCELWRKFNGAESMACDAIDELIAERDELRAKIEAMEKQEPARLVTPTAYRWRYRGAIMWQYGELTEETARLAKEHNHEVQPLYALPGAHPAPSVPDGWIRAIDEALVVTHLGVANASDTYEQAKAKLDSLIGFHVDVAIEPAVNGGWKLVPNVPEGFSREDLEAVADGLDGYEKTVNVGNVTGEGDDHLESTTAYAARFIRAMLAATEAKP